MIGLLVDISSCLPTAVGFALREQWNENGRFLFPPVCYPFQQGLAYPFRSVCADAESEGGYRFEVVNLNTAFVRYTDSPSYPVLPQNSALCCSKSFSRVSCLTPIPRYASFNFAAVTYLSASVPDSGGYLHTDFIHCTIDFLRFGTLTRSLVVLHVPQPQGNIHLATELFDFTVHRDTAH